MNRATHLIAAMLALAGCGVVEGGDPPAPKAEIEKTAFEKGGDGQTPAAQVVSSPDPERACQHITFEEVRLTHCIADPKLHEIRTILGPVGGAPYRGLGRLAQDRATPASRVVFAMNAGMFDDFGQPIGYYVEKGRRLSKINLKDGYGNFHMKPNGVFFGENGVWRVLTSEKFAETVKERPDFGTQSGPMLVIDGELHPRIEDDGKSRKIRNAVGVDDQGRAHFVISEMPLSFGKLARLYRDELGVDNALYLDGTVSALWEPLGARIDASPPLGPLLLVEKRAKAPPLPQPTASPTTEASATP